MALYEGNLDSVDRWMKTAPAEDKEFCSLTLSAESTTAKNYELSDGTYTATGKIEKADSTITAAPNATGITYGQALSDSTLSGGAGGVPGTFAWTNGSTKPSAGTAQYEVTFTPTDTVNYNTAKAIVYFEYLSVSE